MIEFLEKHFKVVAEILVPILVGILGLFAAFKKSSNNQKIRDIHGDNNTIINGDLNITETKRRRTLSKKEGRD